MNVFRDIPVTVTGASGFVGGHVARRLLADGAKVTLLLRNPASPAAIALQQEGARIIGGDLQNKEAVRQAVSGSKYVFHIAAMFREAKFGDDQYFLVNAEGTRNILEASCAEGVTRVLHCSTNGVHGGSYHAPINEDAPFDPADVYQESKVRAEQIVQEFAAAGRIETAIIRPAMIWGEGDYRFLKLFRGIARRMLPIIGTGKTWTHGIEVSDLVDAFLSAATAAIPNGSVYLIAGDRPILLKDVYATIAKLAGVTVIPLRVPALPLQIAGSVVETLLRPFPIEPPLHRRRVDFYVKNRCFITDRAVRELGYKPKSTFEGDAAKVYQWYQANNLL